MKAYEVIWDDGYYLKVKILSADGVKMLEAKGFYFDDFFGDGTERWSR